MQQATANPPSVDLQMRGEVEARSYVKNGVSYDGKFVGRPSRCLGQACHERQPGRSRTGGVNPSMLGFFEPIISQVGTVTSSYGPDLGRRSRRVGSALLDWRSNWVITYCMHLSRY